MAVYKTFQPQDALAYAVAHTSLFEGLDPTTLSCSEIGDGNLNLVFKVSHPGGASAIVKQALPYARCVGESWPLTLDRARIEAEAMLIESELCPALVPTIYHYDAGMAVTIMEDLSDHVILRQAMVAGEHFPRLIDDMARFLADTLFFTSDLYLDQQQKKARVAQFINPELCKITEDLFFLDPYCDHERNNVYPGFETRAAALWHNEALKGEVAELKFRFLTEAQALLHGDVHAGSIFVRQDSTKVIDAEFAYYGPMGFDIGSFIGNMLLNFCGQWGLMAAEEQRNAYRSGLLESIDQLWSGFAERFSEHLSQSTRDPSLNTLRWQSRLLRAIWQDTLGYAGCELIRRTVGLAHVKDLDSITDEQRRLQAAEQALILGEALVLQRHELDNMADVLAMLVDKVRY
ncbi:S-methyl-5-thioribose kinase [Pokkaliibacter sp. MBI-7]|uniref:S-methyl-5-thioribose kinase n=1 Tax=Pokkaliibacter sp. MBI-7 TaxID=3040600 RepID=UPI00244956B6|nr:S-methyl-5-thioribose kinase [Pokkaliibacter sp. MBI-7]MDH2432900.1 S-methyl-5-thioribose kinase [Pokkaliibacter sp. MBI-7]